MADATTPTTAEKPAAAPPVVTDQERGYTAIEWHGQQGYQSLITGHTTFGPDAESEMIAYHAMLPQAGVADPNAA